jgi:hypothetical protein
MENSEAALQSAASFLRLPAEQISVTDVTAAKFPWSRQHAFFIAMSQDRRRLLTSVDRCVDPALTAAANVRYRSPHLISTAHQ